MSEIESIDPERRALFGFSYGSTSYRGWFDFLFQDYSLYPYLNIMREETKELFIQEESVLQTGPDFFKAAPYYRSVE